jgi:glutaminase
VHNEVPTCSIGDEQFRLFYAAYYNDIILMQRLNIMGWSVNAYDYDGRTALGVAASQGNFEGVKYLVSHGANPFHKDFRGNSAFDDAKRENHREILEYL